MLFWLTGRFGRSLDIASFINGTPGAIPIFLTANTIGNSILSEAGSVITANGGLEVTSATNTSALNDASSGALIQFNASADNDTIISSDNGAFAETAVYVSSSNLDLYAGIGKPVTIEANDKTVFNGTTTFTSVSFRGAGGANVARLELINNSAGDIISSTGADAHGVFLSAHASTMKAGVTGSLIIGGTGITGKTDDVVYVPKLGFYQSGTIEGLLDNAVLTADRAWTLPNISGEIIITAGAQTMSGDKTFSSRANLSQGTDTASANVMTINRDGNYIDVTGNAAINWIINTGWSPGETVTLQFDSNPVVADAAGAPPPFGSQILLNGSANFATTIGSTLTLVYDGTNFKEIARMTR